MKMELKFCKICVQMTNHKGNVCLKCNPTKKDFVDKTLKEFDKLWGNYDASANSEGLDKKTKDFFKSKLHEATKRAIEGLGETIDEIWKEMQSRIYDNTMKGKNNPSEVSEQDWQNASFTIEEFRDKIIKAQRLKGKEYMKSIDF